MQEQTITPVWYSSTPYAFVKDELAFVCHIHQTGMISTGLIRTMPVTISAPPVLDDIVRM